MKRDIAQFEWNVMAFQDVPDRDAERRPGKLNQREHAGYMTEGVRNCKVGKSGTVSPQAEWPADGQHLQFEPEEVQSWFGRGRLKE